VLVLAAEAVRRLAGGGHPHDTGFQPVRKTFQRR
jgi:hypothetical protein